MAARWVDVNFEKMLPPGTLDIINTVQGLLAVVQTPLEILSTTLEAAKTFLLTFPAFNFLGILADVVKDFKASLLGSGFFICEMWDFPIKQLKPVDEYGYETNGPDAIAGQYSYAGTEFSHFKTTLINSMYDLRDPNRPQYRDACALAVMVVAVGSLDKLPIGLYDGNIAQGIFSGMSSNVKGASYELHRTRYRGAFLRMRLAAESYPPGYAARRVERVEKALRAYNAFDNSAIDAIPIPFNAETGDQFFESTDPTSLDWDNDIAPVLEIIEDLRTNASYPDWKSMVLSDLYPPIVDIINTVFDPVIEMLEIADDFKKAIIALIDGMKRMIQQLAAIINEIDKILEQIENFFKLTGFYGVFITSATGIPGLVEGLNKATNPPLPGAKGFFSGFAMVAGSDILYPFKTLLLPIFE